MASVAPSEILRAELERLFDLEGLQKLSRDLLGLAPDDVAAGAAKSTFARALVDRAVHDDMQEALADAIVMSDRDANERLRPVFDGRPAEELPPGTTIEGFRIVKRTHDEGFGTVYLATTADNTHVNLKILREGRVRDRRGLHRFLLAQRALKAVDHPAVQRVIAAGMLPDGRPYLAAEHIDGQLLSTRLGRAGAMHINEAKGILQALCEGLDKVHALGLAHADIRTEHVMLVRRDGALSGVLVDFGVDRLMGVRQGSADAASLLLLMGAARGLAPERARLGVPADARSDVYALGALTWEVLTGKAIFSGASPLDLVVAHITQEPEAPSKVAPRGWVTREIDAVVLRALAKEPEKRFATAGEFFQALTDAMRGKRTGDISREEFDARKAALAEAPADDEKALALENAGNQGIPWADVAAALREVTEKVTEDGAKKPLLFRLARVLEAEVKDLAAARAVYESIAAMEGSDEIARAKVQEIRRALATPEERAEILLEEIDAETVATERARLYVELARLYERALKDDENALVAYTQALVESPADDDIAHELERVAGEDPKRWGEVLQSVSEATKGRDEGDATALYLRAGRWYQEKALRPDFALACYTQVIAQNPGNDAALEGAANIYKKSQQWAELIGTLLKRADAQSVPSRARDLRAEAADLLDAKLNDAPRAREMCEKVLAEDPAHPEAAGVIERILLRQEDWKGLVRLLERKAEALSGEKKAEALCEIAETYEDRLADTGKAAEYFELAREADARNLTSLKGLERLYARANNHEKLLKALEAQLTIATTPRQKVELQVRVGALLEEEFVDHARAVTAYEEALKIDPANDPSLRGLGRLYRVLGRWDELATLLERHATIVEDSAKKVELLVSAGRVLFDPIGAIDRALRCFERALEVEKAQPVALEYMARIAALKGDTRSAVEAYEGLVQAAKTTAEKVELLLKVARILEEKGDRDAAIERYKQALDVDPDSVTATTRLRELYAARGDAAGAIELLQREIEAAEGSNARAALWAQVARIYRERMKDKDKARNAAEKAILLDATNEEASALLGELKFEEGEYAEAARLFGPKAAKVKSLPKADGLALALKYGEALARAGDNSRALEAFASAREIAPGDRDALLAVARANYRVGAWAEAQSHFEEVLRDHGDELERDARVEALLELSEAARKRGQLAAAAKAAHDAHELDAHNTRAIELASALHAEEGRWDEVVKLKRKRVESAPDAEKFELYLELGELLSTKLGEKSKAARAYASALEIKPDDRKLLTRLMQLYSDEKDWGRLVEIILRLADLVDDRAQLGKYYLTAAQLCDKYLSRGDEALDYYELALEQNPTLTAALDGLAAKRATKKDWEGLEKSYRSVLGKMSESAPKSARARVHARLGELYEKEFKGRTADAIVEYERATELAPAEFDRTERLAELYVTDTKRYAERAEKTHRALLARNPLRVESLHALRRVFTEQRQPDPAWCLCQALVTIKGAEPEEESFFKKFKSDQPAEAQEKLTDERWTRELAHPHGDALLTSVFGAILPAVVKARAVTLKSLGLAEKDRIDPATDAGQMAQTIHYAAGVLGLKTPAVYAHPSDASGLNFALTDPPGVFLGSTAQAGGPSKALAFLAGAKLAYFRSGHLVRQIVPTGTGLRAWLFAAIRAVQPNFPVAPELVSSVNENAGVIKSTLSGSEKELLTSLVTRLLQSESSLDLKRWTLGVDLTADRAGFLLANDLGMALAVIRATPEDSWPVAQAERIRELRLFAISDEYFKLRQRLGIAMRVV